MNTKISTQENLLQTLHTLESENERMHDVLDKIRADIKAMFPPSGSWMYDEGHEVEHTACEVLGDVLQIIDKYRVESEE